MRTWHMRHKEGLTFGQKAADKLRNGMGSWTFVWSFLAFMGLWAFVNQHLLSQPFDPYPFILLNLLLSTLAGLQGAILLIAAKRQDEISSALAQHDYETNLKAEEEIRGIAKLIDGQTTEMNELKTILVNQNAEMAELKNIVSSLAELKRSKK